MFALLLFALQMFAGPPAVIVYPTPPQADVRSSAVTLDSTGTGTWNFTADGSPPFDGVPDVVHMPKSMDTQNQIICNYVSVTATSVTVRCARTNVNGLLSALLGGVITGATVNLVARYHGTP